MKSSDLYTQIKSRREELINEAMDFIYDKLKQSVEFETTISIPVEKAQQSIRLEIISQLRENGFGAEWKQGQDIYGSHINLKISIHA